MKKKLVKAHIYLLFYNFIFPYSNLHTSLPLYNKTQYYTCEIECITLMQMIVVLYILYYQGCSDSIKVIIPQRSFLYIL